MKTIKYIIAGSLLIFSCVAVAQVNNNNINININKDTLNPQPVPVTPVVPAQEPIEKVYHGIIGARFMPTVSLLNIKSISGETVKGEFIVSYGYGGLLGLNFNNYVGVQLEGIYYSLSQKYKDSELDRQIDINYLNFPALLSLNTGRNKPVNLNFVVGPQWGINLGSKVTTNGSQNVDTVHAVLAVKKNDFGIAYGAGLDFALNKKRNARLDIGFRGVYGLINISDDSKTIETNQYYILEKVHIQTYSAYIGFLILF